ncbi:MAG: response regulator transcription factor [Sphingobacteriales bacterium]|nr:MAG: response regulator transcription factor [Sphingobacteriales bacterium]
MTVPGANQVYHSSTPSVYAGYYQVTDAALKNYGVSREKFGSTDVIMPEKDGITTCQELRKNPNMKDVFIIFLTARIEEYSEIAGFTAGADDYITKPIKPGALTSRIKAILKRKAQAEDQPILKIGDLVIDRSSYEVAYKGEKLHFARKEFELLYMLANQPGKVFNREKILEQIWGNDVFVGDRTVDVHIRKIREKIDPESIKTIKGIGYKFELA